MTSSSNLLPFPSSLPSRAEVRGKPEELLSRREFLKEAIQTAGTVITFSYLTDGIVLAREETTGRIHFFFASHRGAEDFEKVEPLIQKFIDEEIRQNRQVVFWVEMAGDLSIGLGRILERLDRDEKQKLFGQENPTVDQFKERVRQNRPIFEVRDTHERLSLILAELNLREQKNLNNVGFIRQRASRPKEEATNHEDAIDRFLFKNLEKVRKQSLLVRTEKLMSFLDWFDYHEASDRSFLDIEERTLPLFDTEKGGDRVREAMEKAEEIASRYHRLHDQRQRLIVQHLTETLPSSQTSLAGTIGTLHSPGLHRVLKEKFPQGTILAWTKGIGDRPPDTLSNREKDEWFLKHQDILGTLEMHLRRSLGEIISPERKDEFVARDVLRILLAKLVRHLMVHWGKKWDEKTLELLALRVDRIDEKIRKFNPGARKPQSYQGILSNVQAAYLRGKREETLRSEDESRHQWVAILSVFDKAGIIPKEEILELISNREERDFIQTWIEFLAPLELSEQEQAVIPQDSGGGWWPWMAGLTVGVATLIASVILFRRFKRLKQEEDKKDSPLRAEVRNQDHSIEERIQRVERLKTLLNLEHNTELITVIRPIAALFERSFRGTPYDDNEARSNEIWRRMAEDKENLQTLRSEYDPRRQSPEIYLSTPLRNRLKDLLQETRNKRMIQEGDREAGTGFDLKKIPDSAEEPSEAAMARETSPEVREALLEGVRQQVETAVNLSDRERQVLLKLLKKGHEFRGGRRKDGESPVTEVARELGLTEGAVKVTLHRTLEKLRENPEVMVEFLETLDLLESSPAPFRAEVRSDSTRKDKALKQVLDQLEFTQPPSAFPTIHEDLMRGENLFKEAGIIEASFILGGVAYRADKKEWYLYYSREDVPDLGDLYVAKDGSGIVVGKGLLEKEDTIQVLTKPVTPEKVNEAWRARERLRQEKDEPTQSARDLRELLGKTVEIPGKPVDEEELAQKGITIFEISREERNQFLSRYNSFWTVHQLEELSEKLKKNATTILTQDDFKDILSRAEQKAFEENLRYLVDYLHKVIQGKPVSTEHPYEGILEGPSQLSNPLAILLHQLKDSDLNITASYAVLERFIQELDQNITKLEESLPPETEDAFHYSVSHFVLEIKEAFARRAEVRLPAGKAETERGGDKKFNEQGLFRDGPYGFEPQDTKGSQKSAPSLRTKSRWDPSFRILSPVGNLQDKPNQPTIKDKTKNKGRQTKSPWSEEPSKNERPQNYGSRIRSHFLEGSQLTLAQILHGGSRVSKIYGYVNSLFTKRYNRFPVFRRAEVRRKEGFGEQINAGGVFAAGDSRLEGWHPSARLLRKPPQKTSRFLMTSPVSFLSLEQIGHKNQQRGTDSSHQKNTSTEGLGLQGEGYDQARENRRIGIQAELHQILSAFWRNLQKRFHSWVSSSSAQGRKSQAIERKSASRRIRRTFWNGVPYQRTSLTKDPLNRNELTITSVLRNRPPHSNLFTRDPHSFTLGTSVQNPIRIFKISQEENHNKLKFRNPPQANSRRAEVRAEKKRGKDNEASERVFFDRVGQSKGVWLSLRRSPQEYKLTSGAFQETRSSFSPLAGTNQPPKISTKKEAPASASFISRLASFTKKSVEMAAGARSENRLRKAFPSSEHRLVPRRSFIDVGYFDKSVTYNSEYVNNYFPDIPSWNLRYGSPRAEVRKEKLEVGSSKLEVEENEEGNLIQLFLPGQRGDRAISASELLRQAEVRREALARRLGRSLDQAVMAPLREKSDGEEIIEALDRLTKDSLRRRLGFWAGWVNVPGLLERVRGAALGRIVPEVYAGAPIVADPAELNQAKQLVWGALSSLDRKTVIEFRIPDLGKVPNRGSLLEELAETVFSAAVLNPELYISILVDSKREEEILNRSLNRRWNKEALAFVKQERIRVIPATNRVLAGLDGPPQMVISPYPQEALTQQKAELAFDAARDANQNLLPYSGPEQVRLGALFLAALTALSQKTVEGLIRRDSLIQAEGPHAFHPFELLLQARLLEGAAHDTMSRAA